MWVPGARKHVCADLCCVSLAAVNFFLGIVGIVQVSRIVMYNQSQKNPPVDPVAIKDEVKEAVKP